MNTPSHLIIGAAAFARSGRPQVTVAAILGSFLPDLSLYLLVGWSINIQGISPRIVFDEYYFSDAWQSIFAVDNSFPLWGLVFLAGIALGRPVLIAFAGAGLLHLLADFCLHNEDARMMVWPLSDWVFRSPLSYYDRDRYGDVVGPVEIALALVLCVALWRRFRSPVARGMILLAAIAEAAPGLIFMLMFRG